jgi:hypothetical protein
MSGSACQSIFTFGMENHTFSFASIYTHYVGSESICMFFFIFGLNFVISSCKFFPDNRPEVSSANKKDNMSVALGKSRKQYGSQYMLPYSTEIFILPYCRSDIVG